MNPIKIRNCNFGCRCYSIFDLSSVLYWFLIFSFIIKSWLLKGLSLLLFSFLYKRCIWIFISVSTYDDQYLLMYLKMVWNYITDVFDFLGKWYNLFGYIFLQVVWIDMNWSDKIYMNWSDKYFDTSR